MFVCLYFYWHRIVIYGAGSHFFKFDFGLSSRGGGLRKYPPKIQKAPFLRKLLMEKYTYIYVNFSKFDPYEFKFTKYSPFWKNFLRSDKHFCLIGQEKDTYLRIKKIYTFHWGFFLVNIRPTSTDKKLRKVLIWVVHSYSKFHPHPRASLRRDMMVVPSPS